MFLNQQEGAGAVQNVRLRIKTKKVVSSRLWSSLFSYGPLRLSPVGSDPLRTAPIGTGRARSTPILFGRLRSTPVDSDRLRSGFGRLRPALVGSDRFRSSRVLSGRLQLAPAVSIALWVLNIVITEFENPLKAPAAPILYSDCEFMHED